MQLFDSSTSVLVFTYAYYYSLFECYLLSRRTFWRKLKKEIGEVIGDDRLSSF